MTQSSSSERDERQKQVFDWGVDCGFAMDPRERARRILEEAMEFAQCYDVTPLEIIKICDYVYSRPVGEPKQELDGLSIVTLAAAHAIGASLDECERTEFARVMATDPQKFRDKHAFKIAQGICG